MPRQDLILFLDLETTGTDEYKDAIIEVGMVMLDATKPGYPEIGTFSRVIIPGDSAYLRMIDKKVVREMHEANGLLDEIQYYRSQYESDRWGSELWLHTLTATESDILKWIDAFTKGDTQHIPLGGSGVLHFDRKFIRRYLPKFDERLTYWAYDVGVLRRAWDIAGMPSYSIESKTHRALDDARVHADEWRFYQKAINPAL